MAILLLLLALLASCKRDKNNNEELSSNDTDTDAVTIDDDEETETDEYGQIVYKDPTEGLNFGGKTVNILVRSGEQYVREWYVKSTQSNVDQAIYTRNVRVEEALGVKLNYIITDEGANNKPFMDKIVRRRSSLAVPMS